MKRFERERSFTQFVEIDDYLNFFGWTGEDIDI
jgi:hypothetical protein